MLPLNKSYKNRKVSLTIHCKYKYLDSTEQRAEDRREKFYFCRLPFAVNVKLNLSTESQSTSLGVAEAGTLRLDLRALKSQNPVFFLRIPFYTV